MTKAALAPPNGKKLTKKTIKKPTKKAPKPSGAVKKQQRIRLLLRRKLPHRPPQNQQHQLRKSSKPLLKLTEPKLPQLRRPINSLYSIDYSIYTRAI